MPRRVTSPAEPAACVRTGTGQPLPTPRRGRRRPAWSESGKGVSLRHSDLCASGMRRARKTEKTAMTNTALLWIVVALVALAVVIGAAIASRRRARVRSAELRRRFGPEYDRTVEQMGSET